MCSEYMYVYFASVNAPVQFFLHCLSICKLFVVFLHCLSICKLLFFCTVWSTVNAPVQFLFALSVHM